MSAAPVRGPMPRRRSPVIVKLGGSVITDKAVLRTLRPRTLARLAREVATAPSPVIVVHGAGSFGHVRAKRHKLADGASGEPRQRDAFAQVHEDVRALHAEVLAALRRAGLAPVGIPPIACARLADGELDVLDVSPFVDALANGFTPVTFGDAVFDERRGFGILSGDVMIRELAPALGCSHGVFATAADGVFDRDPANADAVLLEKASPKDLESVAWGVHVADVTRGMGGKLAAIAACAEAGVPVTVVNGNVPGRVTDALGGRRVLGTRVAAPGKGVAA